MDMQIFAVSAFLASHLDSSKTGGCDWPAESTHCVVYNTSTWPCGWDKESQVVFFESRAMLDAWVAEHAYWAELEDNYLAYQAYEWDLGPNKIAGLCKNTNNIRPTYQQNQNCLSDF